MKTNAWPTRLRYFRFIRLVLAVLVMFTAWLGFSQDILVPILKDDFAARPTITLVPDPGFALRQFAVRECFWFQFQRHHRGQ